MMLNGSLRVLVCPLDWGLGHASRCIPIIRELVSHGVDVMIAGEGFGMLLVKEEFPDLQYFQLRGYRITFSSRIPLGIKLLLHLPRIFYRLIKEHYQLAELVRSQHIDIIISDNRYGLWNKNIKSIFITHQLNIIPPKLLGFTAPFLRTITRYFIQKYDECWIPDTINHQNISGSLSHGYPLPSNTTFIGPLSRFDTSNRNNSIDVPAISDQILLQNVEVVALLSGPEPQRSQLEDLLKRQLSESTLNCLMLRGITGTAVSPIKINNLAILDHLSTASLESILRKGPIVICRGGYSTLMDLVYTGNKVICIPTPGQTEQEYLTIRGDANRLLVYANQVDFNLSKSLNKVASTKGIPMEMNTISYKQTISHLINTTLKKGTV